MQYTTEVQHYNNDFILYKTNFISDLFTFSFIHMQVDEEME